MALFCAFSSGSRGNCGVYVNGGVRALIDAGTSTRYIASCLRELGMEPRDLTHIVLTHAHNDHVSALPVLMKHTGARLVCTEGTYSQLKVKQNDPLLFWEGESFVLGDVPVNTAPTLHDCFGSCCYAFGEGAKSLGYCTDLGKATAEVFELLRGRRSIFIEANHDLDMLRNGPYPEFLKSRVMSRRGHLSNTDSASLVAHLAAEGAENVTLAHISETNNRTELALNEARGALVHMGAGDVRVSAAEAFSMTRPMEI